MNKRVLVLFFLLIAGVASLPTLAVGQSCAEDLATAENLYNTGRFDQAIALIDQCLDTLDVPVSERIKAYQIKGLCYVSKGQEQEAREAIQRLLLINPTYQTNPTNDPPLFRSLVEDVRTEMAAQDTPAAEPEEQIVAEQPVVKQKNRRTLRWIAAGAGLAAGAVVAILVISPPDDRLIDEPPPFPPNQ